MRMLSLLVAPVGIILIQFAINKNKTTKSGNKLIGSICDNIIKKINNTGSNEEINYAIMSIFEKEKVQLAYNTQTIYVKNN